MDMKNHSWFIGVVSDRIDKFFINHKEDGYYNLISWINLYKDKINDNNDFPVTIYYRIFHHIQLI